MRSFADGNGDGTGDLAGVRARLGLPARSRRRRHLVQPWYPSPARRRRLRRRRLPGHRPGVRHARGRRAAHRRGPRPGHPHDHRHRPQPRLRPAPVVPGGPRRPGPGSPERERFWFRPGRAPAATSRPTTGLALRRLGVDPHEEPRRDAGRVVPPPLLPEQPDLNWDHPDVRARARGRSCASGSTAASPASASTRRPAGQGPRALPDLADARRAGTPSSTATRSTTSTARGGRSPTPTIRPAC